MYFIRWLSGDIHIYKRNNNFPIKDLIIRTISENVEKSNLKEIRNNFTDKTLILVYDSDFENSIDYPQIFYTAKDGQILFSNFFIVGNSKNEKEYSLLSAFQINTVIKEML